MPTEQLPSNLTLPSGSPIADGAVSSSETAVFPGADHSVLTELKGQSYGSNNLSPLIDRFRMKCTLGIGTHKGSNLAVRLTDEDSEASYRYFDMYEGDFNKLPADDEYLAACVTYTANLDGLYNDLSRMCSPKMRKHSKKPEARIIDLFKGLKLKTSKGIWMSIMLQVSTFIDNTDNLLQRKKDVNDWVDKTICGLYRGDDYLSWTGAFGASNDIRVNPIVRVGILMYIFSKEFRKFFKREREELLGAANFLSEDAHNKMTF